MDKAIKDMTFDELVDWASGELLQGLLAGKFRATVYSILNAVLTNWKPK